MNTVGVIFGGVTYSETSNTVYFGADDGMLYALDANTGESKLGTGGVFFPAESPIWGGTLVQGGVVYFGTMDGRLYGVSENGGKTLEFRGGGRNRGDADSGGGGRLRGFLRQELLRRAGQRGPQCQGDLEVLNEQLDMG